MRKPLVRHSSGPPVPEPSPRPRATRLVAALSLTLLIGAGAYVATRPEVPAHAAGAGIGQRAPDFVALDGVQKPLLVDLDGNPIRLSEFAAKPLWIVFWTTWCIPCQQEASDIRAAYEAHRGDDLAVLAIDIQEPAGAVREYALGHGLDYTIGLDTTAAVKAAYGAWGLPTHFFLDGNGVIRDRYFGQMTRPVMETHLRAIIGS
jgi:cytochrome c biogenesis protein CcmG, thiol:disulfide interchange protein DsbE